MQNTRVYPLHNPEIRLIALLIVATKLCFPFNGGSPLTVSEDGLTLPSFDWSSWQSAKGQPVEEKGRTFEGVTPNDVANMTDDDLDAYFRHIASFLEKKSECAVLVRCKLLTVCTDTNPVADFFPIELEPVPDTIPTEPTLEEIDDAARTVLQVAMAMPSAEVPNKFIYEAYRKVDDLSPTAKIFYDTLSTYFCFFFKDEKYQLNNV